MDITNFISWFINETFRLFSWIFNLLDSITFFGTSLLKFSVNLIIVGVCVDLMVALVKNRGMQEKGVAHYERVKREKQKKDSKDSA